MCRAFLFIGLQIISIAIIIVTFNIPMFFLFSFTSSSLTDGINLKILPPIDPSRISSTCLSYPLHLQLYTIPSSHITMSTLLGPIYQTLNSLLSTESLQSVIRSLFLWSISGVHSILICSGLSFRRLCVGSPVYWFQKSPPINFMLLSPTLPDVDPVKLYSTWNEWIETRGNNQYLGHKRK